MRGNTIFPLQASSLLRRRRGFNVTWKWARADGVGAKKVLDRVHSVLLPIMLFFEEHAHSWIYFHFYHLSLFRLPSVITNYHRGHGRHGNQVSHHNTWSPWTSFVFANPNGKLINQSEASIRLVNVVKFSNSSDKSSLWEREIRGIEEWDNLWLNNINQMVCHWTLNPPFLSNHTKGPAQSESNVVPWEDVSLRGVFWEGKDFFQPREMQKPCAWFSLRAIKTLLTGQVRSTQWRKVCEKYYV